MDWKDILLLLALIAVAVLVFYRAFKKKKWCPAIYGSDHTDPDNKENKNLG